MSTQENLSELKDTLANGDADSRKEAVTGAARDAAAQTKDVAANAKHSTAQVAGTAAQGVQQVAGEARQQAGVLAHETSTHIRSMFDDATSQFRDHAAQQTDRAATGMQQIANELQALVSGRTEEAGKTGEYVGQVGTRVQELAERLQSGGLDGFTDDLRRVARKRPGAFLAGAGAIGFGIGRLLKGSKAVQQSEQSPAPGTTEVDGYDQRIDLP